MRLTAEQKQDVNIAEQRTQGRAASNKGGDMKRLSQQPLDVWFWPRIRKTESGCWEWQGAQFNGGYGRIKYDGQDQVAHRVAYLVLVGPIPEGMTLDHLCRNRICVNPEHLEPVDMRTNVLRGETITAANAHKEVCLRGHPLSGDNLFVRRDGRRRCRECERERQRHSRDTDTYRNKHAEAERARRAQRKEVTT